MRVRTLIPHVNGYGTKPQKVENDEYDLPDAAAAPLIAAGLVVQVGATIPPPPTLTGTATASGVFGPFAPALGRQMFVTIAGTWEGLVTVCRSVDNGATLTALTTDGGRQWGAWKDGVPVGNMRLGEPGALSCNEPVPWNETEAGATYWIAAELTSGTLSYRLAQ